MTKCLTIIETVSTVSKPGVAPLTDRRGHRREIVQNAAVDWAAHPPLVARPLAKRKP